MHYYSVYTSINTLVWNWLFSQGFFFLCNLLQAANSQLVIREVRATTAMRENSMKQINIRASHNGPLPKTYRTTKVGFFRFCLLFFSVFFMDAECHSLGPDDLLSKRVTRVSWLGSWPAEEEEGKTNNTHPASRQKAVYCCCKAFNRLLHHYVIMRTIILFQPIY